MSINILNKIDKDITLLLDNLPVGIIRLNKNKECIYVNKFIYNHFKIGQNNNTSTILYEIFRRIHPDDLDKIRIDDENFLLDNIECENIFRVWIEEKHDWIWVNNKKIIIYNEHSENEISYMYTFEDINNTKNMEIQLINEREKVENAYKHKSVFLANMSHEIRTPLNGIIGMLTLLEDSHLSNDQKDYINMIKECSFNLMTIINDILDYSKLEIGKIILDNKPININRCIESVNDIIISRVIEKSIDYSYNINSDIPKWIMGDCNRLKQILLNLMSNAIKFTDSGSIFLNIEMVNKKDYILLKRHSKYEIDDDDISNFEECIYLRFDITDTGCGIDISEKDKLFKSFSQIDNKIRTKIYQGTGLGLAICKELVELMGGYIWLDWSEIRNGSRFSFVIRTKICDNIKDEICDLSDSILQDLKVMILDDNVHNRISLSAMINKWGMKAYSFSNSEEALYFTKITHFDIGLIDICMPKIDGPTFAKRLRESDDIENRYMPLVALSSIGDKILNTDDNFICYLTKPIKELRLKQKCIEVAKIIKDNQNKNKKRENINNVVNNIGSSSSRVTDSVLFHHLKTSIRILLAEDVYINQKVISSFLNKLGYNNIKVVDNGAKCLDILKDEEFDIILMDIRMPLISGDNVLNEIVQYYKTNSNTGKFKNKTKPYVIAITAYCLKEDKNKYLEMGFDDYIPKPINIDDLSISLDKGMNRIIHE